jgi:hypothetical protein
VDSGFGNSIYWTLPVVTTIIHFTALHHIKERLYLLSSVFRTALPDRRTFASVFCTVLLLALLSYCLSVCLHVSASSVSHPLKRVLGQQSWEQLIEGLSLSGFTKRHLCCAGNVWLRCCENNCLPSRYNGNASVRCLGNDPSIPALRHLSHYYKK